MPFVYCIDVIEELKKRGITTYRIRKEKLIPEGTMTKLRRKEPISWESLERLCELLECNIGDIIEYVKE